MAGPLHVVGTRLDTMLHFYIARGMHVAYIPLYLTLLLSPPPSLSLLIVTFPQTLSLDITSTMPGSLTAGRERLFSPITSARTSTCIMHPLGRWNGTLDYSFHREIICFFVCVLSNPFLVSALTLTFIWLQTKCSFICPNRVSVGICPWNFPFFVMGKQASCGVLYCAVLFNFYCLHVYYVVSC